MKKILSILLVVVMSIAVFAGCKADKPEEPVTEDTTQAVDVTEEVADSYMDSTNNLDEIDDAKGLAEDLNNYAESILEGETEGALEEYVAEELSQMEENSEEMTETTPAEDETEQSTTIDE